MVVPAAPRVGAPDHYLRGPRPAQDEEILMANKATTLKGTNRTRLGKGASRQARRDGLVPAVVYGHGSEPRHVVLDEHATRLALRSNENALIELDIDGETLLVLTKEVQRHPIRPGVQHVDFLLVNRNERVEVEIPVTVVGEPEPGTIHMIELAHLLVSASVTAISLDRKSVV